MSLRRTVCDCNCVDDNTCFVAGEESDCPSEFSLTVTVPSVQVPEYFDTDGGSIECEFMTKEWSHTLTLKNSLEKPCTWKGYATPHCTQDTHCMDLRSIDFDNSCWIGDEVWEGISSRDPDDEESPNTDGCWSSYGSVANGCDCLERVGGDCNSDGRGIWTRKPTYRKHIIPGRPAIEFWCNCDPTWTPPDPSATIHQCGLCSSYEEMSCAYQGAQGVWLTGILSWNTYYEMFTLSIKVYGLAGINSVVAFCDGEWTTQLYSDPECRNTCVGVETDCLDIPDTIDFPELGGWIPGYGHVSSWFSQVCYSSASPPYTHIGKANDRTTWGFPDTITYENCTDLYGTTQSTSGVFVAQSMSACLPSTYLGADAFAVTWELASA